MSTYTLENNEKFTLVNVHAPADCDGRPCPIHNRTDHSMRSFPQWFRSDNGLMERTCPHGVGHPDPDGLASWEGRGINMGIHGCCYERCCISTTDAV